MKRLLAIVLTLIMTMTISTVAFISASAYGGEINVVKNTINGSV